MTPDAAEIIARALDLPPLPSPPLDLAAGSRCAITGAPITTGYPLRPLLQASTAVILDTIRGSLDGAVSDAAARCWKSSGPGARLALGVLAFEDGTAYQGRIALDGRHDGRGCWRDIVQDVWPARRGQRLVWILTTDTKKRLWPGARAGPIGEVTPVFLYDGNALGPLTVSWPRLLDCLARAEDIYARGFAKPAIRDGLLSSYERMAQWGIRETLSWERAIAPLRGTPEWTIALLIAQRETVTEPPATGAATPDVPSSDIPVPTGAIVQRSLFDV